MKPKALLSALVISGIFAIPGAALSRDETNHDGRNDWYRWSENDARHLQGRWYLNGDPNKPTTITVNGRRLEATNENGNTSRLEMDRFGNIRASDWRGIRGSVKGNRIQWDNGTTWTRMKLQCIDHFIKVVFVRAGFSPGEMEAFYDTLRVYSAADHRNQYQGGQRENSPYSR